jgi:hypothetical protein
LMALLLLSGCAKPAFTKIGDLLANPEKFSAKEVSIRGKVTKVLKTNFVTLYKVQDGSGEINVNTEGEVPSVGSEVRAKGVFEFRPGAAKGFYVLQVHEIERW